MTGIGVHAAASSPSAGAVVLVTSVGAATGAKATAAALACKGAEPDRASLLIDLKDARAPRPSLVATAAARDLEERLAVHLPQASVASRGSLCQLTLPAGPVGIEGIAASLPLVRDSVAVIHLPQGLLQPALVDPRTRGTAVLLRADLGEDRALAALAARDLIRRGLRVAVLKRPLGWFAARQALLVVRPAGGSSLPDGMVTRLLRGGPSGQARDR